MKNCSTAILILFLAITTCPAWAQTQAFTDSLSRDVIQVTPLQNNYTSYGFPQAITGKGVIVGIVDVGFQPGHPNFYDKIGTKNRVVRIWDQADNNGVGPAGFNYGRLYADGPSILNFKDKTGSHGTHVTGIAAGSGYGSPNFNQSGNAPEADIVMVSIRYSNDTIPPGARGDYMVANPAIIDAYNYIFKYADSVGKPAVINLSWGMHTGPHDGTSVFDKAVDALVGQGKVIVGALGNDRGRKMHFNHTFANDTVSAWVSEWIKREETYESIYTDFWGSVGTQFSMQINVFDSLGNFRGSMPFVSSAIDKDTAIELAFGTDTVRCLYKCVAASLLNGKPNILLNALNKNPFFNYLVVRITSANTALNAWNSGGVDRWSSGGFSADFKGFKPFDNMLDGNDTSIAGENGGTSKGVISVGAYATAFYWTDVHGNGQSTYALPGYLAGFSSQGPTVDGRIKPDVSAPGVAVSSSVNKYYLDSNSITYITHVGGDTNYFGASSGTSMASPQVTGIVALMLQQNPLLTNEQIRTILQNTAVADSATGTTPNNFYGYGKVNALAALQYIAGTTAVQSIKGDDGSVSVYPNPVSQLLFVDSKNIDSKIIKCCITTLQGQLVQKQIVEQGNTPQQFVFDVRNLAQGIYLLQIETTTGTITRKIVKQ